jgi:NitT/TauT family transport system permease protein
MTVQQTSMTMPDRPGAALRRLAAAPLYLRRVLPALLFLIGTFVTWELFVRAAGIPSYILPPPSLTFSILIDKQGPILAMAAISLQTTLFGFFGGISLGLALGILIGSSRSIYETVYPALVGFHAVPVIALIPLFVVWFGIGMHIGVITGIIVSFFPVTVIVATAVAASSPELEDVMRALGARKLDIMLKVSLPRAMPEFFSSIKLAITGAFIGTIVAETVAANSGIGYLMVVATNNLDSPLAIAGLLVLSAMGIAFYCIALLVERQITGWAYRRPK